MEDLTGRQFGPYQVVAPLGEGGMAAVYKAYQPSIDRYVALKVLPRHFSDDPEFIQRFKQEARVIANLQHPHILPVHDFGESDGYTYMAMRFIRGGELSDWIAANQPLSLPQIQRIISQIGDALDYAHSQNVIHRDVKPSNVLIDERGNCLLTDFGLAKMMETSVKLTRTGGILGTPAYMSPEQGLGQGVDHRSDIYALGVILYEMVTGRPPYQAETPMAIMIKHIQAPLPPPSQHNPDMPESVERVILKSLAKDKEERFATAAEMVQALQRAAQHPTIATGAEPPTIARITPSPQPEPETAVPTPPSRPEATTTPDSQQERVTAVPAPTPSPQPQRRKRRIWLLAIIALVLLAGAAIILQNMSGVPDDPNEIEPFVGEIPDDIEDIIDEANADWEIGDLEEALDDFDEAIALEPGIASLHCQRGELLETIGDLQAALESYDTCFIIAENGGDEQTRSHAFGSGIMTQMRLLAEQGETDLAVLRGVFDDALADPAAPDWLYCERGELNLGYADNEAALADFEKCQSLVNDSYWDFRAEAVLTMLQGQAALEEENYQDAITYLERWAELDPEGPWAFCSLGYAYTAMEAFPEAEEAFARCFDIAGAMGDTEQQREAESGRFYTIAKEALRRDAFEEALKAYNQAINLTPDNVWLYCERGEVHWDLNKLDEARADFEQCFDRSEGDESLETWAGEALDELP